MQECLFKTLPAARPAAEEVAPASSIEPILSALEYTGYLSPL